jgi:hypothetical protein
MKRCVLRFRINIRDFNTFVRGEAAKSRVVNFQMTAILLCRMAVVFLNLRPAIQRFNVKILTSRLFVLKLLSELHMENHLKVAFILRGPL